MWCPRRDFYSDVYQSFLNLGLKPDIAEDKAFKLIGVLSSRGPNIYKLGPAFSSDKLSLFYSMLFINNGIPVLNSASQGTGHLYSYPSNVKGDCDNGKAYHFWMSAFLARKITKEGKNSNAAINATYLTQIGYQMKSETTGRDPNRAFMVDSYDFANNLIRLDLASASAGAVYGASVADKKPLKKDLNVDEGLRKLLIDAGRKELLGREEAEKKWQGTGTKGYFRWRNIFSPDSALDLYKKSLK